MPHPKTFLGLRPRCAWRHVHGRTWRATGRRHVGPTADVSARTTTNSADRAVITETDLLIGECYRGRSKWGEGRYQLRYDTRRSRWPALNWIFSNSRREHPERRHAKCSVADFTDFADFAHASPAVRERWHRIAVSSSARRFTPAKPAARRRPRTVKTPRTDSARNRAEWRPRRRHGLRSPGSACRRRRWWRWQWRSILPVGGVGTG